MEQVESKAVPETELSFEDQVTKLVEEKKKIQDEFDVQRAKLKELFLQKEAELQRTTQENKFLNEQISKLKNDLDDCKSQLVVDSMNLESTYEVEKRKAYEEIATLQRLVNETVEESSSTRKLYDIELSRLEAYIQQLQKEITDLKQDKNQSPYHSTHEYSSLAPSQVLNVLTKGLKKLGADSFSSQESVDENNKKNLDPDPEVMNSLVEPLVDQIQALKEKLRAADEQLQKCRECNHTDVEPGRDQSSQHVSINATTATNTSFDSQKLSVCDMCSNYEAELVKEQKCVADLQLKLQACEKSSERHREELLKEIGFRKEMEEKWNEKKEEHKQQVAELTRATECTEQDLKELRHFFNQSCAEMKLTLAKLTHERESIYQEITKLQKENENLVGKYTMHSQELQSQAIDLPSTVDELHELILKTHQELIIAKIGKEAAEESVNTLQSDILLLKDRISNDQHERKTIEEALDADIKALRKQINQLEKEKKVFIANQEKFASSEKADKEIIDSQHSKITDMSATIKQLEKQNQELRTRVSSLQQELDTTETVQKDFVRLSQSLQVQLEKIRESDVEVRWQHEEDIDECPGCHTGFSSSKQRKLHCRHCGQIFCHTCLAHSVPSGPNRRPSKVCDVCHTLLVKSSAPYFSEAPPMT